MRPPERRSSVAAVIAVVAGVRAGICMIAEPSLIVLGARRRSRRAATRRRIRTPPTSRRSEAQPLGLLGEADPERRIVVSELQSRGARDDPTRGMSLFPDPSTSRHARATARSWRSTSIRTRRRSAREDDDAPTRSWTSFAAEAREAGLWAPHVPPEAGGTRLRVPRTTRASTRRSAAAYAPSSMFGCQAPDAGNAEILHLFGTDEQKERFLRPLVAGEVRSFFSMTEPEVAGSDPTLLRTRAVRDGDEWVIDGHKWFSSGRGRGGVRHRHGDLRARRRAAPARDDDPRPGRHAGRRGRSARARDGARGARLEHPLRGALHGRARAGREHPRRRGGRASVSRRSGSGRDGSTT